MYFIANATTNASESGSRSEFDSHAKMIVVGKHCVIINTTGKTCTVNAFSPSDGKVNDVPIVDAVIAYDCPIKGKAHLLLMRNALYIPEVEQNLIPPFILREGGILVDECPKSQSINPTLDNHSMYCRDADLRIHFELTNTFSSFPTRKPTQEELSTYDKIFITPDSTSWDPYSTHYSANEDAMLNADFELAMYSEKREYLLEERSDDYLEFPTVNSVNCHMDEVIQESMDVQSEAPEDDLFIPLHEAKELADGLSKTALHGKIAAAVGSSAPGERTCPLFTTTLDDLEDLFQSDISSMEAHSSKCVTPDFIKKIWSVSSD